MTTEEPALLEPDEFEIFRRAFLAQIKALTPIEEANDYALEALAAYQATRAMSYLGDCGSCECPNCSAEREEIGSGKKKVN